MCEGPDGAINGTLIGRSDVPRSWDGWRRTSPGWWVDGAPPSTVQVRRALQPSWRRSIAIGTGDLDVPLLLCYGDLAICDDWIHTRVDLDASGCPTLIRIIEHEDLAERLRGWLLEASAADIDEMATYQLAADLLAVGAHVCLHDLAAWGWLDDETAIRVIRAAVTDQLPPVTEEA
jgi:hypothetical protein